MCSLSCVPPSAALRWLRHLKCSKFWFRPGDGPMFFFPFFLSEKDLVGGKIVNELMI